MSAPATAASPSAVPWRRARSPPRGGLRPAGRRRRRQPVAGGRFGGQIVLRASRGWATGPLYGELDAHREQGLCGPPVLIRPAAPVPVDRRRSTWSPEPVPVEMTSLWLDPALRRQVLLVDEAAPAPEAAAPPPPRAARTAGPPRRRRPEPCPLSRTLVPAGARLGPWHASTSALPRPATVPRSASTNWLGAPHCTRRAGGRNARWQPATAISPAKARREALRIAQSGAAPADRPKLCRATPAASGTAPGHSTARSARPLVQ